jgi:DNA sulfur modification protein DndD
MIFSKIILQNFRQFKGKIEIGLDSKDKTRNIVVFLGNNGAGKTTLSQSLRYCMYGGDSNYLKLSRLDELINNTLVYDMDELSTSEMFVELHFESNQKKYIAKRSIEFKKVRGKLVQKEEDFLLSIATSTGGYKAVASSAEAINLMYQMMPPGLAYLYLFDGERLEKNISRNESLKEVQETIRGFLNLKKYEVLIERIGSEKKQSTLINALESSVGSSKGEEQEVKEQYNQFMSTIGQLETDLEKFNERSKEIEEFINRHKDIQRKQSDISDLENQNTILETKIRGLEQTINDRSDGFNNKSEKALLNKALLSVKSKYDGVMENHQHTDIKYFKNLHVDTLEQILSEEMCVCGTEIKRGTVLYERINTLFETALPNDYTSNIASINEFFTSAEGYSEELEFLDVIHREIIELKHEKNGYVNEVDNNKQLIKNLESQLNRDDQLKIDEMIKEKELNIRFQAEKELLLKANEGKLEKIRPRYDEIVNKNDANRAVRTMIELLKEEAGKLSERLIEEDRLARTLLAKHFNFYLAQVLPEKYEISIDDKYRFRLEQVIDASKDRKVDSTEELSKGQSAVLSMVFLRALLETSKEMSKVVRDDSAHGIVMDASMATLDSKNVHRLATKIVSDFDQLLFLSVDRQLRDEMFEGIKDKIGKAYVIENKENIATIKPIGIVDLEERLQRNSEA